MTKRTTAKIRPAIDANWYEEFLAAAKESGESPRHLLESAIEHYIRAVIPSRRTVRLEVMDRFRASNEKFRAVYRKLAQ